MIKTRTPNRSKKQRARRTREKAAAEKLLKARKWEQTLPRRREILNTFNRLKRDQRIKKARALRAASKGQQPAPATPAVSAQALAAEIFNRG